NSIHTAISDSSNNSNTYATYISNNRSIIVTRSWRSSNRDNIKKYYRKICNIIISNSNDLSSNNIIIDSNSSVSSRNNIISSNSSGSSNSNRSINYKKMNNLKNTLSVLE